jgi:hypothetical protein
MGVIVGGSGIIVAAGRFCFDEFAGTVFEDDVDWQN